MKKLLTIYVTAILFALPASARAERTVTTGKSANSAAVNCPMIMGGVQNNMSSMMQEVDSMMSGMSDPAMRARMQKLHDQMGSMMSGMGYGMMNCTPQDSQGRPTAPASGK